MAWSHCGFSCSCKSHEIPREPMKLDSRPLFRLQWGERLQPETSCVQARSQPVPCVPVPCLSWGSACPPCPQDTGCMSHRLPGDEVSKMLLGAHPLVPAPYKFSGLNGTIRPVIGWERVNFMALCALLGQTSILWQTAEMGLCAPRCSPATLCPQGPPLQLWPLLCNFMF